MILSAGLGMRVSDGKGGASPPSALRSSPPEDICRARKQADPLLASSLQKYPAGVSEARGRHTPPFLGAYLFPFGIIKRGQMHGGRHARGGHV